MPTLALLGAEPNDPTYNGVTELADQINLGILDRVPGHHLALVFEPDAFVAVLRSFLMRG